MRERIEKAWENTPPAHRETLLGERKAGSKWGRDFTIDDWRNMLPTWRVDINVSDAAKQPGCTYLTANIWSFFPNAQIGAWPWSHLSDEEQAAVEEVQGVHGPELQLRTNAAVPGTWASLILGMHEGKEIVFTSHPGPVLKSGVERAGITAVKLAPL